MISIIIIHYVNSPIFQFIRYLFCQLTNHYIYLQSLHMSTNHFKFSKVYPSMQVSTKLLLVDLTHLGDIFSRLQAVSAWQSCWQRLPQEVARRLVAKDVSTFRHLTLQYKNNDTLDSCLKAFISLGVSQSDDVIHPTSYSWRAVGSRKEVLMGPTAFFSFLWEARQSFSSKRKRLSLFEGLQALAFQQKLFPQ